MINIVLSKIANYFCFGKRKEVLIIGLEGAGKSSLLYKLLTQESKLPVVGFSIERYDYKDYYLTVWDYNPYPNKVFNLYKYYFKRTDSIILMIDSVNDLSNIERLNDLKHLIHEIILKEPELEQTSLLILANKQDLPNAISDVNEITIKLGLNEMIKNNNIKKHCNIILCSIKQSIDSVSQGFDWLNTFHK